ncbi:MAG TPA: 3'-5' exonuclease, partial [Acidobacteriota bacterium]|nr:3'-5' exonuclease [Acidobacteriota bacterium]
SIREGRSEEERRLCYVAMTRAEEKLYLVQTQSNEERDTESMFLGQMGQVDALVIDRWSGDDEIPM